MSMKPTYEELELKLEESQREFRAADATIENLQMELNAEREAKLALAAENAGLKSAIDETIGWQQSTDPVIPDGWVACSERMPEIGIKVLCFPVNDEPIHATYNGQVWLQDISWSTSDEPIDNVIPCNVFHWQPLPAAPQQE